MTIHRRPWSVDVTAVVIVTHDEAVILLFGRALILLSKKRLREVRATGHFGCASVLNNGIAGGVADDGKMIVIRRQRFVGCAGG